jgi:uncharacterized membrane protein
MKPTRTRRFLAAALVGALALLGAVAPAQAADNPSTSSGRGRPNIWGVHEKRGTSHL